MRWRVDPGPLRLTTTARGSRVHSPLTPVVAWGGQARFCGVAEDADYLAKAILLHRRDANQERLECTALPGS